MKTNFKSTFSIIFLLLVLLLMLMPVLTTFNELLTAFVLKIGWYQVIENWLLPFETRMMVAVLQILGQEAVAAPTTVGILHNSSWQKIAVSWNCIGWQSILVLGATLFTGIQGPFTLSSKINCIAIGLLGTFLINILRISIVALLIVSIRSVPAAIIHDYSSVVILILWLFFFWWFAYGFVLEERKPTG